jgi:hypothetical protein
MAGKNNFNATTMDASVYDADGALIKTTRPNARELVATGNFFWKTEDIGKSRTEEQGPENPAAERCVVYAKATGEAVEVVRANARDLVTTGKYTWAPAHVEKTSEADDSEQADDADDEGSADAHVATTEVVPTTKEPTADDPLDPMNSPLHEIAARVTGDADVKAYLDGFTEDNLRDMAAQRYGEKVHHRASKDTIIAKMMELEEAKLDADVGVADEV